MGVSSSRRGCAVRGNHGGRLGDAVKEIVAAVLLTSGLAVGALALGFRAETLDVPGLAATPLPKTDPPATMTLSALPTGSMPSVAAFSRTAAAAGATRATSRERAQTRDKAARSQHR